MIKNNIPCIIATLTALMTLPVISAKPGQDFIKIFDGKTLDGWEAMPAKTSPAWTVEDGMIVGNGAKARSYIVYQNKSVADLELKFTYRFPGKGNSGVSIRAIVDPTGKRGFQSYHADIGHLGIGPQVLGAWDFHTPGRKEHRCFRGERLVIDENDKPTLTKIKGAVPLGGCNVEHLQSTDAKMFPFKVTHCDFGTSALYLAATTAEERDGWVDAIRDCSQV